MPLSPAVDRQHLHTRQIECRGFYRADGLWDIEGHITDVKTYGQTYEWRGDLQAGDPVHEMWIRLTLDDKLTIHAVEAVTDNSPYRVCPDITPNFQRLVGLSLTSGFRRRVREVLGGVHGCVHLVELLGPVATVAFQTIISQKGDEIRRLRDAPKGIVSEPTIPPPGTKRKLPPSVINTCHAWAADGENVKELAPDFYTGPRSN
jgi:hypothetical protein